LLALEKAAGLNSTKGNGETLYIRHTVKKKVTIIKKVTVRKSHCEIKLQLREIKSR